MYYIRVFAVLLLCVNVFCSNVLSADPYKDYAHTFVLPINHLSPPHLISLSVEIPEGYRPLQDMKGFMNGGMIEYIPQNEDENNWSSIITILPLIGKSFQAKQFISRMLLSLKERIPNVEVLETNDDTNSGYTQSSMGVIYTNKGRSEVLYTASFPCPADSINFQYTRVLKPGGSPKVTLNEIKQQMSKMVKVIEGSMK